MADSIELVLRNGLDRKGNHRYALLTQRLELRPVCRTPDVTGLTLTVVHLPRLFREPVTHILVMTLDMLLEALDQGLATAAFILRFVTPALQAQMAGAGHPADLRRSADGALECSFAALPFVIGGIVEPPLEIVPLFTNEIIDNHGDPIVKDRGTERPLDTAMPSLR